jgi:hypothetical protein
MQRQGWGSEKGKLLRGGIPESPKTDPAFPCFLPSNLAAEPMYSPDSKDIGGLRSDTSTRSAPHENSVEVKYLSLLLVPGNGLQ